jgi:checkpoint serine/threonine-protein kinase
MASTEEYKRQQFRDRLALALNGAEEPLVVYDEYADWIISTFGRKNPNSGLQELLKEATDRFKGVQEYKANLRYLKLWGKYAAQLDEADALEIYSYLFTHGIGRRYAALYLEFASLLEKAGRNDDAEKIYQYGIKNGPKRVDKLEQAYSQFMRRTTSTALPPRSAPVSSRSPPKRHDKFTPDGPIKVLLNANINPRYAMMLAPLPPDKRPEKRRFDLSLLFTEDGIEYSAAEARARSLGLYGKQWSRPPGPFVGEAPTSTANRNSLMRSDDGTRNTRALRRKSLMVSEPTVTMNTKEALEDVYGMYNSPEKTMKLANIALRRVDASTPASLAPPRVLESKSSNENPGSKIPAPAFKSFSSENASTPAAPKFKPFTDPESNLQTPFITPRNILSQREVGPTPNGSENDTARKPAPKFKTIPEDKVFTPFTPVFTPKQQNAIPPHRESVTEDLGKFQPKPSALGHQRAHSQDAPPPVFRPPAAKPTFTPFTDENARVPPRVFSLPVAQNNENGLAIAKPTFTPFKDNTTAPTFTPFSEKKVPFSAFTPFRDVPVQKPAEPLLQVSEEEAEEEAEEDAGELPEEQDNLLEVPREQNSSTAEGSPLRQSWSPSVVEEDNGDDYQDDFEYDENEEHGIEPSPEQFEEADGSLEGNSGTTDYEEDYVQRDIPLGGRFGQFNVMTPITERTFEFTTTSGPLTIDEPDGEHTDTFCRKRRDVEILDDVDEVPFEGHSAFDLEEQDSGEEDEPANVYSEEPVLEERTRTLDLADQWTRQASFKPSNPCSPLDPDIISALLSFMYPDNLSEEYPNQDSNLLDSLLKFAKKAGKRGSSTGSVTDLTTSYPVTLGSKVFDIYSKLGEGAFGSVFKAHSISLDGDDEIPDDEDAVALKVVKPAHPWEFHVLRRIHGTISPRSRSSIVRPLGIYGFRDESFLVLNYCSQGSLLDVVNNAGTTGVSQQGGCLDELLVIFFTVELLRVIGDLHASGFIHGDLKIDNCLLRLEVGSSKLSNAYSASGEGGWEGTGITLIDFGRSIDTKLFPAGQQFIADWPMDERDCPEIREDRPWTYQTDYYGLVGIIYCMLFGKYMLTNAVTVDESTGRYAIATHLKRYWQTGMWNKLFDFLLNPITGSVKPPCDELAAIREEMEAWLQVNSVKLARGSLKTFVRKLQISVT